jgi:serine phosphatase RsbU (regulator of sigma subunit)
MCIGSFFGVIFYFFSRYCVDEKYKIKKLELLVFLPSIYIVIYNILLIFHPAFSEELKSIIQVSNLIIKRKPDANYLIYTASILCGHIAGLYLLIKSHKKESDKKKKRLLLTVFASTILGAGAVIFFVNFAILAGFPAFLRLTIVPVLIAVIAIALSILRNRAWTIENLLRVIQKNEELLNEKITELNDAYFKLNDAYDYMKQDLVLAKEIQNNMLPCSIKSIDKLKFNVRYIPQSEVGGDIYDIEKLSSGSIRVFIADAKGHGVQAAMITMIIMSEFEILKKKTSSPSSLLEELNARITSFTTIKIYFTCFLIDIDLNSRKIVYASAGHPSQILITGDKITELKYTGRIIGLGDGQKYNQSESDFSDDDKLILFTDGIIDEKNEKTQGDAARNLIRTVQDNIKETTEAIINKILQNRIATDRSADGTIDDITIIGISCR